MSSHHSCEPQCLDVRNRQGTIFGAQWARALSIDVTLCCTAAIDRLIKIGRSAAEIERENFHMGGSPTSQVSRGQSKRDRSTPPRQSMRAKCDWVHKDAQCRADHGNT